MKFDIKSVLFALRNLSKRHLSRKNLIVLSVVAALLFAFAAGGIYGKYTHQSTGSGLVTSEEFYFESNVLAEADAYGEFPRYELAAGTGSITFNLNNFADDLRYTGYDIVYGINVSGEGVTINDSNGGGITGGAKNSSTITLSNLKDGTTYIVTAATTNGYAKTLGARLEVVAPANGIFAYLDTTSDSHYVELILWTEDTSGTVTVTAPSGLIPDVTKGVALVKEVSLNEEESVRLRYFKENTGAAFTLNEFTFSTGVTPATPH